MKDMIDFLFQESGIKGLARKNVASGRIGIFDATNSTRERRKWISDQLDGLPVKLIFVESYCDDKLTVKNNIWMSKVNNQDYKKVAEESAYRDFKRRIEQYEKVYATLEESELTWVKLINSGQRVVINNIHGFLPGRIVQFLTNIHATHKPLYLTRHGQSEYNLAGKIGGDAGLTEVGRRYAVALGRFAREEIQHGPDGEQRRTRLWTSSMQRTIQTVTHIPHPKLRDGWVQMSHRVYRQLDELYAGICDGMTYAEIEEVYPDEFKHRQEDKLAYRYPRGESYLDIISRLEPLVHEMESYREPLLIVGHQAVLRLVYAYFAGIPRDEAPRLSIPLNTVRCGRPARERPGVPAPAASVDACERARACERERASERRIERGPGAPQLTPVRALHARTPPRRSSSSRLMWPATSMRRSARCSTRARLRRTTASRTPLCATRRATDAALSCKANHFFSILDKVAVDGAGAARAVPQLRSGRPHPCPSSPIPAAVRPLAPSESARTRVAGSPPRRARAMAAATRAPPAAAAGAVRTACRRRVVRAGGVRGGGAEGEGRSRGRQEGRRALLAGTAAMVGAGIAAARPRPARAQGSIWETLEGVIEAGNAWEPADIIASASPEGAADSPFQRAGAKADVGLDANGALKVCPSGACAGARGGMCGLRLQVRRHGLTRSRWLALALAPPFTRVRVRVRVRSCQSQLRGHELAQS